MGVPGFFSWLIRSHPRSVIDSNKRKQLSDCYGLYIDLSTIVHHCLQSSSPECTFDELVDSVLQEFNNIFSLMRPKKLVYIAMDGGAPAKKRRRQTQHKHEQQQEQQEEQQQRSMEVNCATYLSYNLLSPRSAPALALEKRFKSYAEEQLKENPDWRGVKFTFSGSGICGEGEHKMVSHMKYQKQLPGADERSLHCLYGNDADIVMLALGVPRSDNVCILRPSGDASSSSHKFIRLDFLKRGLTTEVKGGVDQLARDFVFVWFMLGNDYLPCLRGLDDGSRGVELLSSTYKQAREHWDLGYLISDQGVNVDRLRLFLDILSRRTLNECSPGLSETSQLDKDSVDSYVAGLTWLVQYYFNGATSYKAFSGSAPCAAELAARCSSNPAMWRLEVNDERINEADTCSRFSGFKRVTFTMATGVDVASRPNKKLKASWTPTSTPTSLRPQWLRAC